MSEVLTIIKLELQNRFFNGSSIQTDLDGHKTTIKHNNNTWGPQEWQFSRPPQKNKSKNLVKMFFLTRPFSVSVTEWSMFHTPKSVSAIRNGLTPLIDCFLIPSSILLSGICNIASSTVSETIFAYWFTASRSKRIAVIDMHNRGTATSLTIEEEKETCFQIRGSIWNFHLMHIMISSTMQSL